MSTPDEPKDRKLQVFMQIRDEFIAALHLAEIAGDQRTIEAHKAQIAHLDLMISEQENRRGASAANG